MAHNGDGKQVERPDSDDYARRALLSQPLREPVLAPVIRSLSLPWGSHGLDAGCGLGLQALLLAEGVGLEGHVTGVDCCGAFLQQAREIAQKAGLSARISFQQADISALPFQDNAFDWAWSADCVGYVPLEPIPLVRELVRVVRPGGTVALTAWSSQQLLPGYPMLEARLSATWAYYIDRSSHAGGRPKCTLSQPPPCPKGSERAHFMNRPG